MWLVDFRLDFVGSKRANEDCTMQIRPNVLATLWQPFSRRLLQCRQYVFWLPRRRQDVAVTDEQRWQDMLRQRDRVFQPHVSATLELTWRQRMFGHKVT